jgi:uronate dehydrogenase
VSSLPATEYTALSSSSLPYAKLLLTGAAGTLGRVLTAPLAAAVPTLVRSDLAAALAAVPGPDAVPCDLSDAGDVHRLLQGVEAVVHLGGVSVERPFHTILPANIVGLVNLYEAARLNGTRRIVFASSNHVTGCYAQGRDTDPNEPARPDGFYGVSKLFGEALGSMYHDRYGIETVCLRIGTATVEPPDRRGLSTWLSHADLVRLVMAALSAPAVGFTVAYGVSANARSWWDTPGNRAAWARLGFQPQDDAERFAAQVEHLVLPEGPQRELQGGSFLDVGPFDDLPRQAG